VSVSTVRSSSKYQNILDYGVKQCVKDLQANKVIASDDFEISEVLEAYTQKANDLENCKLKVRLTNSIGISLDVSFNVQVENKSDKKSLTSYSVEGSSSGQTQVLIADYQGEKEGQLEISNCEKLIPEVAKTSSNIQKAIDYGVSEVLKNVAKKEKVDTSSYSIKEIKNVYRDIVNASTYRVDAILKNSKGSTVDCSFNVDYQASTSTKQFLSYSYIAY